MYSELEVLDDKEFKRLCWVSRMTFAEMVEVLRPYLESRGKRGGQAKLSVEDQLSVALEYWREYRSQFHIRVSRGIHETTVGRIVRKVEDILIKSGTIEEYHRGLKRCCGAERARVRSSRAQRHHIGLSIRAFLRLELHWFATGISWYEAKQTIVRDAIRAFLTAPRFSLHPTA